MSNKPQQYYVKAAFMEIYNEQLRDILNPSSGILHCRWNPTSGFFVEDLMVVECSSPDDLIAVLHEGMKNRQVGAHELNKDSSRSHCILTVYLIQEEVADDGHIFKKYGKVSFVDLAGSERLKESKSEGKMAVETGNINKSLFTLGKVISGLSDNKKKGNNSKHIPYRDSKLTMLLQDSLGGNSKALMIACVSPSHMYLDETMSTLNYATRTMNIKNKPIIQMDAYEKEIFEMKTEAHRLRLENEWLKKEIMARNGGQPIQLPDSILKKAQEDTLPPIGTPGSRRMGRGGAQSEMLEADGYSDMDRPPTPNSAIGDRVGHTAANFAGRADYQGMQMMQEFDLEILRLR